MAAKKKNGIGRGRAKLERMMGSRGKVDADGFIEVDAQHMTGFWRPHKKGDLVQGKVIEMRDGIGPDGKASVHYRISLTNAASGPFESQGKKKVPASEVKIGSLVGVSGWVGIATFLTGRENEVVKIIYDGLGKPTAPGRNPPLLFRTYVQGGE